MALVLSGERSSAAATSMNPLLMVAAWFAKTRVRRVQHLALTSLLDLDDRGLADLGIERADLFDAMQAGHRPTRFLTERRARRS